MNLKRCHWVNDDPRMIEYHDKEWGTPCFDEQKLFELLTLEIFQAGLSWSTILKYRSGIRKAFDNFDYHLVSKFDQQKISELINNANIIQNKAKIIATVANAKAILILHDNDKSLSKTLWKHVNYIPLNHLNLGVNNDDYSKFIKPFVHDLKLNNFKRVGPVTVYSLLQAAGIVNDHEIDCFRYSALIKENDNLPKGIEK